MNFNNVMRDMNLENKISNADYYLIGIGEEFQYNWNLFAKDNRYNEIVKLIEQNDKYDAIIPFLHKYLLEKNEDKIYTVCLEKISAFLKDKNYFVISTGIDDYIWRAGFDLNRVVAPCGGFRSLQCDNNCENVVYDIDNTLLEKVEALYNNMIDISEIELPTCSECGMPLTMNQIGVSKYCENGYLSNWNNYTKWLQGTMNRNVFILELGMGMQFPTVFRWPMEKLVTYNYKARLVRVHSTLHQIDDNIKERAVGIKINPKDWIMSIL